MSQTANVGLYKPAGTENLARVDHFNENWDAIDALFAQTGVGETNAILAHLRDVALTSSYTGSQSKATLDLQPTWNTSGTMHGVRVLVTHTAAGGNSRPIEVRRGANIIFDVDITTNTAVNGVSVRGGAVSNPVQLVAVGADSNIDIALLPKGTGNVRVSDGDVVVASGGRVFMNGASANTKSGGGITILDANNPTPDEAITLKHSSVAHGMTSSTPNTETDTAGHLKVYNVDGGMVVAGLTESIAGLHLHGFGVSETTTASSVGTAQIVLNSGVKGGGSSTVSLAAASNLVAVQNSNSTVFIIKGDGDVYNGGGSVDMTTFDDQDDLALVENYRVLSMGRAPAGYRTDFAGHMARAKAVLVERGVVTLTEDGAIDMVSYKGIMAVLMDTLRQEGYRLRDLEGRLAERGIL
jgi:hypothetical protein